MNILLADDDRIVLRMLQSQLEEWGLEVLTASDGAEAWEKFENGQFSVVITDWMMPRMDGLELIRRIRKENTKNYVYVLLLTVKDQIDDLVEGLEAGADDFLRKPFDRNELRARLRAGERAIQLERRLAERNELLTKANGLLGEANARMKRDIEAAAEIQRSLLPSSLPTTLKGGRFAWSFQPCDAIAGDILNVLPLDDNHVAFYLLDVCGHGVPAALFSVTLSRLLTPTISESSIVRPQRTSSPGYRVASPREVLAELNRRFTPHAECGRFFTMVYAVFDLDTHNLCYSSGGHNPAILSDQMGQTTTLESNGPLVGVFDDAEFGQSELAMESGDRLLVYSDGITEATNEVGEQFGMGRLLEFVRNSGNTSLEDSLSRLLEEVNDWSRPDGLKDDVSCLSLEAL